MHLFTLIISGERYLQINIFYLKKNYIKRMLVETRNKEVGTHFPWPKTF